MSALSAESLVLPNIINKCLDLRSLTSAKDVIFPKIIHEDLWLFNLKTTEGLIIPQNFNCINLFSTYITMQDLIDKSMENKDEYRK